ncbi:MAG: PBP1A family penicillin-binding protein [Dialister sp.]|nr:PBP1A family penicillin-binding protein [Dialister sp.]
MKNSDIRRRHLQKKRSPLWKRVLVFLFIILCIAGTGTAAGFFMFVSSRLPDVSANIMPAASSRIYDAKGRLITTVHAEENRIPVPIAEVPANLQNAFVAAEDVRFYEHHGIDPRGILRAVWNNLVSGNATGQGGSTITQQLARNAFLTQEQTIKRKLLEVVLALEIENKYTKKQILEMYMNQIYFGQGCYGIQTASRVYFNKDVKDLTLAQSALLAGLPNSPNYYSPFRSEEAAKYRQGIVLDQMAKYGYISQEDCDNAKKADLQLAKPDAVRSTGSLGQYFVNYIIAEISDKYDSDAIYKEGLQVYTTLDLDMQREAEAVLRQDLPADGKDANGLIQPQGALMTIENKTGYIKAMVGGRGEDHFNRATQMTRQPGSAFKPFVYVTAFANNVSPYDMVSNETKVYGGWNPKNYGGTAGGKVPVAEALVYSMNLPTIDLANSVGMGKVIDTAKAAGISTLVTEGSYSDVNLSAAIGGLSYGVSVYDMTKAYSVFANGGKLITPVTILKVVDRNGNILEQHVEEPARQVIDENACYILTAILEQVVSRGTGGNAYIGRPAAGKTGTTDDEHDAWFVGYTPEFTTAVWIGDDASSNAGYTGGTIPAAIWRDFMREVESGYPVADFDIPWRVRQQIATAQAKQAAEDQKKKEEEEKKKKNGDKSKSKDSMREAAQKAGSLLLDRIAGKKSE